MNIKSWKAKRYQGKLQGLIRKLKHVKKFYMNCKFTTLKTVIVTKLQQVVKQQTLESTSLSRKFVAENDNCTHIGFTVNARNENSNWT